MSATFARTIPAALSRLGVVLDELEAFLAANGVDDRAAYATQLVCEELAANTIRHGCDAADAREIDLSIRVDVGASIQIHFEDNAPSFDPTRAPAPITPADITDARIGGLGIHLIRRSTASFTWSRAGDRNCIDAVVPRGGP